MGDGRSASISIKSEIDPHVKFISHLPSPISLSTHIDQSPCCISSDSKYPSVRNHDLRPAGIANVEQRVGTEQHDVGHLSRLDRPQRVQHAEETRRLERGRAEGFERRESGAGEMQQLLVQAESGWAVAERRIGSRHQPYAGTE